MRKLEIHADTTAVVSIAQDPATCDAEPIHFRHSIAILVPEVACVMNNITIIRVSRRLKLVRRARVVSLICWTHRKLVYEIVGFRCTPQILKTRA